MAASHPGGARSGGPWSTEDATRLLVTNTLALTLILAAAYQSGASSSTRTGLAWLSLGVAGVVVSGVGNGLWLLRGLRSIGSAAMSTIPWPALKQTALRAGGGPDLVVVKGSGVTRYHRRSCPLVTGKRVIEVTRELHPGGGLSPCGVCEP